MYTALYRIGGAKTAVGGGFVPFACCQADRGLFGRAADRSLKAATPPPDNPYYIDPADQRWQHFHHGLSEQWRCFPCASTRYAQPGACPHCGSPLELRTIEHARHDVVPSKNAVQSMRAVQKPIKLSFGRGYDGGSYTVDSEQGCQAVLTLRWPHRAGAGAAIPGEGGMIGARRQLVFSGIGAVQEGKILPDYAPSSASCRQRVSRLTSVC